MGAAEVGADHGGASTQHRKRRIMELSDESTYIEKRAPRKALLARRIFSLKPAIYPTKTINHNGL